MMISSNVDMKPGDIMDIRMTDKQGTDIGRTQKCFILRRVTRQEWIDEVDDIIYPIERLKKTKAYNAHYFYEISTD
jgi:hypothetical protein